jgi:hypothetical protein
VAKLIRASRSALPVLAALAISANVSLVDLTSRITVRTVPPPDVVTKIVHQLFEIPKNIFALPPFRVPMVTLASLVVVSDYAITSNYISEPILETMLRRRERARQSPNHNFDERIFGHYLAAIDQLGRSHVVQHTNTTYCWQQLQHRKRDKARRISL